MNIHRQCQRGVESRGNVTPQLQVHFKALIWELKPYIVYNIRLDSETTLIISINVLIKNEFSEKSNNNAP